jgi:hypothetical protein
VSVPDEAIYRCIEPLCAKALPRRVNYCPYCGTAQHAAAPVAISADGDHLVVLRPAQEHVVSSQADHAAVAPQTDHATIPPHPSHVVPAHAGTHAEVAPPAALAPAAPASATAQKAPISPDWGATASAPKASPSFAKAAPPPPGPAIPIRPPQRQPIRLRWWLLALAFLWMVWFIAKPSTKKIDARINNAITLATDCKSREAQSELIALRQTRASPEQLQRLQDALNSAATECRRQRKKGRALSDAGEAAAPLTGATNGVARPRPNPGRQGTGRAHPLANDEP